jgi:predicted dehydrogenase
MKTIRWGMIGCGEVAEVKSGPGFYKARHSQLVAVMRRDRARAADFARRHNVPRWHDDADAIIEADDIDAVYIATLTDSHHDYTLRCAAARKPVYVEKPMALELAHCIEMADACKANRVPLWVAYYRRTLPRFVAVRDAIAAGEIGDVRMVSVRQLQRAPSAAELGAPALAWRADAARGGGLFFEGVGHTLDILDFLLGPIADVHAFADNQAGEHATEDVVVAGFRFASHVYGSGTWCYASGIDDESVDVVGSRGTIRFSITRPVPIRVTTQAGATEMPIGDPPHVQQPLIQSIVDELNGEGRCPSSGESALRTARVLDAIVRDYRERARPSRGVL